MKNPTLKETYRSKFYETFHVARIYVRFCSTTSNGSPTRRQFKFYEVNDKNRTIREYYSDGRELDAKTRKEAKEANGQQVRWGGQF